MAEPPQKKACVRNEEGGTEGSGDGDDKLKATEEVGEQGDRASGVDNEDDDNPYGEDSSSTESSDSD